MFTGIIEAVGAVEAVVDLAGGRRLRVEAPFARALRVDASVAVDGACLTVVSVSEASFEAVAVEETLAKTTLGARIAGDAVNLERAMRVGERLDGHVVQGHVDTTGVVEAVEALDDSWTVRVGYPARFAPYLVEAGSVALDGISLTVARLDDAALTVAVIPHTWSRTTMSAWTPGRRVNLELDVVGKYVVRTLSAEWGPRAPERVVGRVSTSRARRHGRTPARVR